MNTAIFLATVQAIINGVILMLPADIAALTAIQKGLPAGSKSAQDVAEAIAVLTQLQTAVTSLNSALPNLAAPLTSVVAAFAQAKAAVQSTTTAAS
jgi:hypothetical protein